jgi:hypothetical protein
VDALDTDIAATLHIVQAHAIQHMPVFVVAVTMMALEAIAAV